MALDIRSVESATGTTEGLRKKTYLYRIRLQYQKQLMVLPAMVFLVIFSYIPMYGVVLAFKDYKISKGIFGSPWAGFHHFEVFLRSSYLQVVLTNTLKISISSMVFVFPAPIILAILLNELFGTKLKRLIQTVSYLPHFVSWVIVAGMVYNMLALNGLINNVLTDLGILSQAKLWLAQGHLFVPLVIFTSIWKEIGWSSIIYLAALTAVDPELHDAARIDGANRFQRAIHISIPTILPTILILFIFALSGLMTTNFDQIFLLQNSAIIDSSETIDTYVFKVGLAQGQFAYGQAVGLFNAVIGFFLLVMANSIVRKITSFGLW